MKNRLFLAVGLPVLAIIGFWVNLFLIGPMIVASGHDTLNMAIYMGFRLFTFIYLSFALTRYAGRNRPQTLSTVMLVGAIDQVFLKGMWMLRDSKIHPEKLQGFVLEPSMIFVGLAQSFLFFAAFILILSFLGIELSRHKQELKEDRDLAGQPLKLVPKGEGLIAVLKSKADSKH